MVALMNISDIILPGLLPTLCFAGVLFFFFIKNGYMRKRSLSQGLGDSSLNLIPLNEKILILILILCAVGLSIPLINRGLIYDELHLATHYVLNNHFWFAMKNDEPMKNHLGYSILAYFSYNIFGKAEWVFRLPALLFGLGNIVILWYLTRRVLGGGFALMAAALLAFSPPNIIWSSSARGYSALVFFSILSTYQYFYLLKGYKKTNFWSFIATNIIGLSFHFFFVFIILTQGAHILWLFVIQKIKKTNSVAEFELFKILKALSITIVLSSLIYIPIFFSSYHGVIKGGFIPKFPLDMLSDLLDIKFNMIGIGEGLLAIIGWLFLRNTFRLQWSYLNILFIFSLLIWLSHPEILCSRYFGYLLPFLFLLIVVGAYYFLELSPNRLYPYTLGLVIVALTLIVWQWQSKPAKLVEDFKCYYREAVEFAQKNSDNQTHFCAFGNEDGFFQFYSHEPVSTFQTFDDFLSFYKQGGNIFCFAIMGPPMTIEHKKIFIFLINNAQERNFDDIIVFYLKGGMAYNDPFKT